MKTRGFEPVSIKTVHNGNNIILPSRADDGSAGYDLFAPAPITIQPNETVLVWLDIKAYMLKDEVLKVYPRSSMGKIKVRLANTTGIIDSSYYNNKNNEGNIGLLLENNGNEPFYISYGQAIGQGIFQKFLHADNDVVRSHIRIGGFGSSDVQGGIQVEEQN